MANLTPDELVAWRNWRNWRVSIDDIEAETGLDLLSNIPKLIQDALESSTDGNIAGISASLLADFTGIESNSIKPIRTFDQFSIRHSNLIEEAALTGAIKFNGTFKASFDQNCVIHLDGEHVSSFNNISSQNSSIEVGMTEISADTLAPNQFSFTQIGIAQVSTSKINSQKLNPTEVSMTEVGARQVITQKSRPTQVDFSEIDTGEHICIDEINIAKITLPSSIPFQQSTPSNQFSLSSHSLDPQLTSIYSTAQSIWHTTIPIDLNFAIVNLPTGQLAEGTITSYNINGTPKTATITIDDDANGVGWFLDTTPQDNSEFTGVDNYLQATPNSPAAGKYDLLTTILHEMGHTLGIINGYSEFDKHIKNGIFTTDTFTTKLTPDGSHLDTTFHPYDLMNTSLKPGVRKLPSALNLAMIDAINSGVGSWVSGVGTVNPAHLTAGALIGINNGDFSTTADWNTAGATNIINGTATLTEQSQKLSELTQAFIIPTGAKTLQFTIKDNHLVTGDTTKTANDAFEVALLDTNTFTPLAGTSIGLTNTDSLLNIQANGTIHKSDKVTITALTNNSSIITIDLTQITPSTQATLYFNLLGFGARTSTVTIDDVKLFTDTQPIPVTKNDTLNTNQNTPLTPDPTQLTTNDTNVTQIQIINQPTHGTLTQTLDGKLTYQPVSTYIGNDSFTYLGFGSDGQISNLATVNLTINNLPPTIQTLTIPTQINEGQTIAYTYTDNGNSGGGVGFRGSTQPTVLQSWHRLAKIHADENCSPTLVASFFVWIVTIRSNW